MKRKIPLYLIPTAMLCAALVPCAAYANEVDVEVGADVPSMQKHPGGGGGGGGDYIPPSQQVEQTTLNYYINLAGDVLDSEEDAGHYAASDFTAALTDTVDVGGELDAPVETSPHHSMIDNVYDAIMGESPDDYVNADTYIRDLMTAADYSVPSDEVILASVKSQIENGATIKDISGETVSSTLVSTDYYKVYWYVLKEGSDEWHVDGILKKLEQPKVTTYTVSYEWTGDVPQDVVLPTTVIYAENDPCNVDTVYYEGYEVISVAGKSDGGYWTFSGWDKSGSFAVTADTVINGVWTYHAPESEPLPPTDPEEKTFTVDYAWSGEAPDGVELPESATYKEGESCKVAELENVLVESKAGTWVFLGWDKSGEFPVTENTIITGMWKFLPNEVDPDSKPDVVPPAGTDNSGDDDDAIVEEEPEAKVLTTKSEISALPQTGDKEALAFGVGLLGMIAAAGAMVLSRFKMGSTRTA